MWLYKKKLNRKETSCKIVLISHVHKTMYESQNGLTKGKEIKTTINA